MNIAKGMDLHEGECAYFPEGTFYGPLSQRGPVALLVMQFPGPNGSYRILDSEKRAAIDALKAASGVFGDGIYKVNRPDGRTIKKDSYEAVWEQHMGRPVSYAMPRYSKPIIMRPQGYQWIPDSRRPGVEIKHLGSFTEYRTSAALWRLARGTRIASEVLSAPELRCVLRGDTICGGKELDAKGCYYIPEGLRTQPIETRQGAEMLVITIPIYARAAWERAQARFAVLAPGLHVASPA